MKQQIDLKQIERKVWTSFYEDGIWDIYLGILLMAMAVGSLLLDIGIFSEMTVLLVYICLVGMASAFLWLGKRFITFPRIGRVSFGPKGKVRKKKAAVVFTMSVIVGLVIFLLILLSVKNSWFSGLSMDFIFPAIWVGHMILVFSLAAYFLRFNRLYVIGAMYAIAIPFDIILKELLHRDLTFVAIGIPSMVILIMGGIVLTRFLSKYQKPVEVVSDGC